MRRFISEQKLKRLRALIAKEADPASSRKLGVLLAKAEREFATHAALCAGAAPVHAMVGPACAPAQTDRIFFRLFDQSTQNYLLIDPRPGVHIVDMTDAYAKATLTRRRRAAGQRIFDIFPDNPADELADGVSNLYASLRTVVRTRRPHVMAVQRYDVRDDGGEFVARYWRPVNTPVFDDAGELVRILHHADDVTAACAAGAPAN